MANGDITIYERGKPEVSRRIDPKVLELILLDDIQVGISKLNRHLEKSEFEGKLDPRTLSVTDEIQDLDLIKEWPYTPWITASFFNDGDISTDPPSEVTAYIFINRVGKWIPLKKGEGIDMDFAKGDERIYTIRHKCDKGETASVRVVGKY
ncbi:hypothetical protein ES703_106806 [subsurface metagenome]